MKDAFENNMLVFRKCKKLKYRYLLFQKIFLLITGSVSLIGGIAAFVYTGNIISLPLLLILWGVLLMFHANLSQTAYQICLAFMLVATLFAKSTDNIFFNEEIFGFLSEYLVSGSLINFSIMFFIVFNIIKTACNPDLFGLFSPRLRHLWRLILDSETGKATILGYIFVPLGLVLGSVLLLGLLWALAVAFFPKLASAPAPQPEKTKSVIAQKADQIAHYSEKVTDKANEYLNETPEAAQKRLALNDQIKSIKQTVDNLKTTPKNAAENSGEPVEASLKDKVTNKAGVYSGKLAGKADEYLSETPEAAQKRTQLQNKLKKANSFLKNVQKLTNDIAK